jgi:hypothetical protein
MTLQKRSFGAGFALWMMPALVGGMATAQFSPIKGEIEANVHTIDGQSNPAVAIDVSGEFVIVWHSDGQDGDLTGIFLRQFEGDGTAVGGEFMANTHTVGDQETPVIGMDANGGFVVVWESDPSLGNGEIVGRRFAAPNQPLGGEFHVNTYTAGHQEEPAVAMRSDGSFIVVWESDDQDGGSNGVFARRYDSAGTPLAAVFQVNAFTIGPQQRPAIDVESDGDFVVAFRGDDGANDSIWARRFTSSGAAQGVELRVNGISGSGHDSPDLAIAPDSSFVVVWEKYQGDGSGSGIAARRVSAAGSPLATELVVNTYTPSNQLNPSIGVEADGDFVVAWQSDRPLQDTPDVLAQRFFASGVREAVEFRVSPQSVSVQENPDVAADPARAAMVIAWDGSGAHDGAGVFAQLYQGPNVDIDGNGVLDPLTDGLLFLRYLFGFRGATLISGAVGPNCTRCTAPQIEAFMDSLI